MIAENHYGDGTMYINMLTTVIKNGEKMTTLWYNLRRQRINVVVWSSVETITDFATKWFPKAKYARGGNKLQGLALLGDDSSKLDHQIPCMHRLKSNLGLMKLGFNTINESRGDARHWLTATKRIITWISGLTILALVCVYLS